MIALLLDLVLNVFDFLAGFFINPLINALVVIFPTQQIESALTPITNFFTTISSYSGFVLSYTGFYNTTLFVIVALFIPSVLLPFAAHGIKLVAKWWEALI